MWISTGDDLQHVSYRHGDCGWEDKTEMSDSSRWLVTVESSNACESYDVAKRVRRHSYVRLGEMTVRVNLIQSNIARHSESSCWCLEG